MKTSPTSLLAFGVLIFLSTFLCLLFFTRPFGSILLAKVGTTLVTKLDVELRNKVIQYYNPTSPKNLGLNQLIEVYTYLEILKKYNYPFTEETFKLELHRIEKETLKPHALALIKNLFKGNEKLFEKIFVAPVFLERVIYYDFFLKNPIFQKNSFNLAKSYLKLMKKSIHILNQEVKKNNLSLFSCVLTNKEILAETQPEKILFTLIPNLKPDEWENKVFKKTQSYQTFPKVMDIGESWLIFKVLNSTGPSQYRCVGLNIPKDDFSAWLENEKKQIPISFF